MEEHRWAAKELVFEGISCGRQERGLGWCDLGEADDGWLMNEQTKGKKAWNSPGGKESAEGDVRRRERCGMIWDAENVDIYADQAHKYIQKWRASWTDTDRWMKR